VIELATFIRTEMAGLPVRIVIDGNTSSPGTDAYNYDLGLRRAKAVAALLRANGVADVEIVSHGELAPTAANDTETGAAATVGSICSSSPPRVPTPGRSQSRSRTRPKPKPKPKPDPDPSPSQARPGPQAQARPDPKKKKKTLCERFPILCGLPIIPIPFLPIPFGLICLIAPELCIALPCIIDPALCIPKPPKPPEPPKPPDKPDPPKDPPKAMFGRARAHTPGAMGDRIPDKSSTPVAVSVSDYDRRWGRS